MGIKKDKKIKIFLFAQICSLCSEKYFLGWTWFTSVATSLLTIHSLSPLCSAWKEHKDKDKDKDKAWVPYALPERNTNTLPEFCCLLSHHWLPPYCNSILHRRRTTTLSDLKLEDPCWLPNSPYLPGCWQENIWGVSQCHSVTLSHCDTVTLSHCHTVWEPISIQTFYKTCIDMAFDNPLLPAIKKIRFLL